MQNLIPLFVKLVYSFNKKLELVKEKRESIKADSYRAILADIVETIDLMVKLSPERQEQLSRCEGIPLMISVCKSNQDKIGECALSIICSLALLNERSRQKLFEFGVFDLFTVYIKSGICLVKICECLYGWYYRSAAQTEEYLCSAEFIHGLISSMVKLNTREFIEIISLFNDLISCSDKFCSTLAESKDLLTQLVSRLDQED